MQLEPHPSQFLSLRESGLWVNREGLSSSEAPAHDSIGFARCFWSFSSVAGEGLRIMNLEGSHDHYADQRVRQLCDVVATWGFHRVRWQHRPRFSRYLATGA